jgi:beta-glucosidase
MLGRATAVLLGALIAATAAAPAMGAGRCGSHPWCDTTLSPERRATLLLAALTSDEKYSLMNGDDIQGVATGNPATGTSNGVPRLDVPTIYYSDGPVGTREGRATAMPAPISLAAGFDSAMARRVGVAIADEVRKKGNDVVHAPTLDIMRTPLAGRTFEGYGEDPWLSSRLGVRWIEGAQSQGVIGNVKHFAPNSQEGAPPGVPPLTSAVGSWSTLAWIRAPCARFTCCRSSTP